MSYIVMKVYSFECDYPGCRKDPWEVLAPTLRDAVREIRHKGWTTRDGKHICPAHTPEGSTT